MRKILLLIALFQIAFFQDYFEETSEETMKLLVRAEIAAR